MGFDVIRFNVIRFNVIFGGGQFVNINGSITTQMTFVGYLYSYKLPPLYIGTYGECDQYLMSKMFGDPWEQASVEERYKALREATLIITRLRIKYPQWIYDSYSAYPLVAPEDSPYNLAPIDADVPPLPSPNSPYFVIPAGYYDAYAFPPQYALQATGNIPCGLKQGCYEIVLGLLQGIDPNKEIYDLMVTNRSGPNTKVSYDRRNIPDFIRAGVPTASAWALIRPYLADPNDVRLVRTQ